MSGAQNTPKGGHEGNVSNTVPMDDTPGGTSSGNPNMSAGEAADLLGNAVDVQLSPQLRRVRDRLVAAFPGADVLGHRGELTVEVAPEDVRDALRFCKDDPDLSCELLSDLCAVHWPGGKKRESAQETTGWPAYETGEEEGRIEVDYLLRSIRHNHWFRIRTRVDDRDPRVDSVVEVYGSANYMEREAYDFFGVHFAGHPDLRRILMPDEWSGHPLRKDYPLGGVEVQYKGQSIPPPDQRTY